MGCRDLPADRARPARAARTLACRFVEDQALQGVVAARCSSPHLLSKWRLGEAPDFRRPPPSGRRAVRAAAARRGRLQRGGQQIRRLWCGRTGPTASSSSPRAGAAARRARSSASTSPRAGASTRARTRAARAAPRALARAQLGLPITLHAAEVPGEAASARGRGRVRRAALGHGYQAAGGAALMAELVDLGVHFQSARRRATRRAAGRARPPSARPSPAGASTRCARCSRRARRSGSTRTTHPFAASRAGVRDLERRIGLSAAELQKCTRSAIAAAFVDDGEKRRLVELAERINGREPGRMQTGRWPTARTSHRQRERDRQDSRSAPKTPGMHRYGNCDAVTYAPRNMNGGTVIKKAQHSPRAARLLF